MNKFAAQFRDDAQPGHYLSQHLQSVEVRATIVEDEYSQSSGEWMHVGVVISIRCNGVLVDDGHASLWGIEGDGVYLTQVANDLVEEVDLTRVKLRLEEFVRSLEVARKLDLGMVV
jgi:hypothetical protein